MNKSSPPSSRLWFGAQTADTDRDWLKQLKRLAETKQFRNCFETVSV